MTTPTDPTVAAIADALTGPTAFEPHTPADGPRSLADGYALQDALAAHLVASGARGPLAGYKLAVNAPALMAHFGVSEPVSGRLFADQCHSGDTRLSARGFHTFAYEPEILAIIGTALPAAAAPFSREVVAAAIDRLVPGFELLDLRGAHTPDLHLPDVVAQNISNAGAVIGGPGAPPAEVDPAAIRTEVTIDEQPELSVTGAAPQDPVEAVRWLANHLAGRGLTLEPGQVILCGTHAPIRPVAGAARIALSMSGLGAVTLTLA